MIFRKIYRIFIFPYTIFMLYLMFLGFGREQHEANIVRLLPFVSTILFVQNTTSWESIIINLFGNIIMFIPFGFLGWLNAKYFSFKKLIVDFLSTLIIVEALQYLTRLGVFDIDDLALNSLGVWIGFQMRKFIDNFKF
ncbi:MAG: VanZ family protein [Flavobacteriaceae bacterium]|nr:VanZ family protein [Flavobacteriaceae bacterium]